MSEALLGSYDFSKAVRYIYQCKLYFFWILSKVAEATVFISRTFQLHMRRVHRDERFCISLDGF